MMINTLEFIEDGTNVFIDANIFLFPYFDYPVECSDKSTEFLNKITMGRLKGHTSNVVLFEVLNKIMMDEICEKLNCENFKEARERIKEDPNIIETLKKPKIFWDSINQMKNLKIHNASSEDIDSALNNMNSFNLLLNDALHFTMCKKEALNDIATDDADFDRTELEVWSPKIRYM